MLIRPGVLFALILMGFILGGFIDARLQRLHPAEHRRLGGVFLPGALSWETVAHSARWFRFMWYEHLRAHDGVLSAQCISAGVLQLAFVWVLFFSG